MEKEKSSFVFFCVFLPIEGSISNNQHLTYAISLFGNCMQVDSTLVEFLQFSKALSDIKYSTGNVKWDKNSIIVTPLFGFYNFTYNFTY